MKKSEILREDIKKAQAELAELERQEANESRSKVIKKLSEFTTSEKVAAFDNLYASAIANLEAAEKSGTESDSDDEEHYAWEALMEIVGRTDQLFWEYYNSL